MMHCPVCTSRLVHVTAVAVTVPLIRIHRISNVLTCVNCAATTEVDEVGRLIDYLGVTVYHLRRYDSFRSRRLSETSLQCGGPLFCGVES